MKYRPARIFRVASRVSLTLAIVFCLGVVVMQFAGIVAKNFAVARELSTYRSEIATLRERKARQLRTIERLQTPAGALPEIHEKLRLVKANEEIIYVRGGVPQTIDPDGTGPAR
ncbi:MAG: hypothetical protein NVS2B3_03620 [Vulcanimicrobiaceae bacterium]